MLEFKGSWGIRDLFNYYDECDIIAQHYFYNLVFSGITSVSQISKCNGQQLIGGYNISGKNTIAERIFQLEPHKRIKIQLMDYLKIKIYLINYSIIRNR
ncbi:hypothetical protein pb186bvf_009991 [Paramecium bursaria]